MLKDICILIVYGYRVHSRGMDMQMICLKHVSKTVKKKVKKDYVFLVLQRKSHIEYLIDTLIDGTKEEKQALVAEQRKEVMKLEQRIAEYRGRSPKQFGAEPER